MLGTLSLAVLACAYVEQGLTLCGPCRSLQELHLQGRIYTRTEDVMASHQQLRRPEQSATLRVLSLTEGMQVRRDTKSDRNSVGCAAAAGGALQPCSCMSRLASMLSLIMSITPQGGTWSCLMEKCVQRQRMRKRNASKSHPMSF